MTRIISIVGGLQPSTPTIGTATAGDTTASVAFTPSTYIGKGTITYTATSSPGGLTATSATSPITVTGLTNGTAYTFTVTGTTNYGVTSIASSASNSITPALGDVGAMFPISSVTITSAGASSVVFDSIPSTYTHLQLRWIGRASQANTGLGVYMRVNNNTGSNYARHWLRGNGSTASAAGVASGTEIDLGGIPGANSPSNIFGAGIIEILDYTNTNKYKTIRSLQGTSQNATADDNVFFSSGFMFANTNAVTRIDVITASSGVGFIQNSSFALYGIKGA